MRPVDNVAVPITWYVLPCVPPDNLTVLVVVSFDSLTLVSPVGTVCVTVEIVADPKPSQVIVKSMESPGLLSGTAGIYESRSRPVL